MITKEKVIKVLKTVHDPEIMIDVWTLGLIYEIKIVKDSINIKMTFTTPLCPYGPMLMDMIEDALIEKLKVKEVTIDVVFEPVWKPSDDLKTALGI